jgi:hypothetical protein
MPEKERPQYSCNSQLLSSEQPRKTFCAGHSILVYECPAQIGFAQIATGLD